MHDPVDKDTTNTTQSADNDSVRKLKGKVKNEEEKKESPSSSSERQQQSKTVGEAEDADDSNIKSEAMGSQTQQNGGDVVMEDAEEEKLANGKGGNQSKEEKSKAKGESKTSTATTSDGIGTNGGNNNKSDTAKASSSPPPPVLRGTLSYNTDLRRHLIRGMWNYENSNAFPPQRFELLRNLDPGEVPNVLPKDGEFHGSFSLAYFHTTSKGKQKERSKVIPESGVKIKFTKLEEPTEDATYKVDGTGTNQFGIFHINGTANPSPHDDDQYTIVLRKRYEPSTQPAAGSAAAAPTEEGGGKKTKKRKMGSLASGTDGMEAAAAAAEEGPLPPPSQSYDKNVVCLRGKVYKEESDELGLGTGDVVHRIHGMWSSGLDLILADPQNVRALCNRFEYEHKSSVSSASFPVSGRYSGWFDLNMEDGSKQKITEKDVTLRFRKNNGGYHNVEGRGSNAFGKYSITGTLTTDHVITIFRHFQPRKAKSSRPVTSAPPPINAPGLARRPSLPAAPDPQLKLDEVKVPAGEELLEPITSPEHPTYSAVSRGVLRLNDDGSHSCQGKWAVTREHFNSGQTSNFTVRLEAHFAAEALKKSEDRPFPLDSEMYKGSFQLKKGGSRYQTVVDQQVVMKFRKNTSGSYNVYGKGVNSIGIFNLTGTLIMSGKTGGQVELYRMYPPALLAAPTAKSPAPAVSVGNAVVSMPASEIPPPTTSLNASTPSVLLPGPPARGLMRRESTRLVKVPSRLEDDDPTAQITRIMDKCTIILRFIREKDVERGAFFSEPVDPVALGIPTYYQVISEPMDLRTLHRKMEADEVVSPEDFARLARLVFENAMTFNVDPTHSVHQAARNLLILFNQKYRDVERIVTNVRRSQKGADGKKSDGTRTRDNEIKSFKRRRMDEAQDMAATNASAMQAILSAAPASSSASVTRNEFKLMLQMMEELQQQVVLTYSVLADMSEDVDSGPSAAGHELLAAAMPSEDIFLPPPVQEKKKPVKRKPEPKPVEKPVVVEDDIRPLTLQEQELLTETINELPADHLHGVIQIIREAAKLTGEEDEIDLEIDQLDTATQRKLLRHVSKFIKQPKRQKTKAAKKAKAAPAAQPKKSEPPVKKTTKAPAPAKKKDPDSFFAFGNNEDSDSDSDSEGEITAPTPAPAPAASEPAPAAATAAGSKSFNLGGGFGGGFGGDDDDDESDNGEEDLGNGAAATSWNIPKPATESKTKGTDEDDEWGAARESAIAAKAREEDKKKREEKMKAEAEQAKNQSLADAVAHGEEIKAQRQAEEEQEAILREEQEKEALEQRRKAREEARAQVQSVEQTVDLDAQRDIMKQYEQNFLDKELGSASPNSDFGF